MFQQFVHVCGSDTLEYVRRHYNTLLQATEMVAGLNSYGAQSQQLQALLRLISKCIQY